MRREWCDSRPEDLGDGARPRFRRLYDFLRSGKVEIRVLPDDVFGLIHGKAGVITRGDGGQTSFLGSANETGAAFRLNYELVWEDDSPEAVAWVQEEFDALWSSPFAVRLADFVVRDLDRLSRRELIGTSPAGGTRRTRTPRPSSWRRRSTARRSGLWEHQKHFVKLAFDAHRGPHGARFVLADQVGLGKTLQLAMAAQLMALSGEGPVLILAPKPLLRQWQDELDTLLGLPSAIWGRRPVDGRARDRASGRGSRIDPALPAPGRDRLHGIDHRQHRGRSAVDRDALRVRDPRRGAPGAAPKPLPPGAGRLRPAPAQQPPEVPPGDLTPHEEPAARDRHPGPAPSRRGLRSARCARPRVARGARRTRQPLAQRQGLPRLLLGNAAPPADFHERWDWLRNPFPPRSEGRDFEILRRSLSLPDEAAYAPGNAVDALRPPDRQRIESGFTRFVEGHNPYIRTIVRRTREHLENTIDPETGRAVPDPGGGAVARRVGRGRDRAAALPRRRLRPGRSFLPVARPAREHGVFPHHAAAPHGQHHGGGGV